MSVLDKIRELEDQKARLVVEAKNEALATAMQAISELNELGFNYQVVEGGARVAPSGNRRTGIRDQVLAVIRASANGVRRADVLEALGTQDKSGRQSISNALSSLKKAGAVSLVEGVYTAT